MLVDIETVPTVAALAAPYPEAERLPPATYKSDEAVAKWRVTDRERWEAERVKACSLDPRLGRVVALALGGVRVPGAECLIARTEAQEADLLERFWRELARSTGLGGFNTLAFDLPFLLVRSLLLGVDTEGVVLAPYLRRYSYTPHFDVRMALVQWEQRASGTLGAWCEAFGIPAPTGSGADVYAQACAEDWAAISTHCISDLAATAQLIARVGPAFGVVHL